MQQIKAIKLPLEYEEKDLCILDGQSKICNWLYNHLSEKANKYKTQFIQGDKEKGKIIYTKRGLRDLIPNLKKELPFLKSVHSSPLKNVALRLSETIKRHQKDKTLGWPHFKSWNKKWFSLFYDEPQKGYKIEGDKLILSLGIDESKKRLSVELKIRDFHILKGYKIRNLRIIKEHGKCYAIFIVEATLPEKKPIKKVIALDPNHKNLVYGADSKSNTLEVESPHWLKIYDKRIDELKSKRDRCQKKSKKYINSLSKKEYFVPSKRWNKYNKTLQRALHKRREQTKTFMFTVAQKLCKNYDLIAIGDYTPHGNGLTRKMRRAMNNRSLIGRFKNILSWTALKSGKFYQEYDEAGTTKTCNLCDYVLEEGLNPSIRYWTCPSCLAFHIRDENSAQNGLKKILTDLRKSETLVLQVPCSGLSKKRWAWRVFPSGIRISERNDSELSQASGN